MATRLYVSSAAAGYTPSTFRGTWTYTQTSIGSSNLGAKSGTATTVVSTSHGVAGTWTHCSRRWVSDPLVGPVTFTSGSHTLSWCFGELVSSTTNTVGKIQIAVFITQGDSDSMRGSILRDSYTGATAFTTSGVGRGDSGVALSNSVSAEAGDRICVELGWQKTGTSSSGRTSTQNYANTGSTDLTAGSTSVTTQPGWIEFSNDFTCASALSVNVSDTPTVTESVTVSKTLDLAWSINVFDSSTVTDYLLEYYPDSPIVTEEVTVSIGSGGGGSVSINVYDSPTVTDAVLDVRVNPLKIDVYDLATLTELDPPTATISGGVSSAQINVFDSPTVTDSVYEVKINPLRPEVYDSPNVTDAVQDIKVSKCYVSVYDSPTVTDAVYEVKVNPLRPSVYESPTVTDVVSEVKVNPLRPSVYETPTITDVVVDLVERPLKIDVYEDITVTDVIIDVVEKPLKISVFDSSTITDVIVDLVERPLKISVFDTATVSELDPPTVTITTPSPSGYTISVYDSSVVTDVIVDIVVKPLKISVYEDVTVTDSVIDVVEKPLKIDVHDDSAITESIIVTVSSPKISVSDSCIVTDSVVDIVVNSLKIDVHEDSAVTDVVFDIFFKKLVLSVSDTTITTDSSSLIKSGLAPLSINVHDSTFNEFAYRFILVDGELAMQLSGIFFIRL